jgi:hypothetical protein
MSDLSAEELMSKLEAWTGSESTEELTRFFDNLSEVYRNADDDGRAALRKAVRGNPHAYASLLYDSPGHVGAGPYLAWLAKEKGPHDPAAFLESALTVISLTDGFGDSRDTLLLLDRLWDEAESRGIEPKEHFEKAAELSDVEEKRHPMFGRSTKGMILQVVEYSPQTGKLRSGP